MATNDAAENITKKDIKQLVYSKLKDALVEFKPLIKRKKFDNKIQKAAKLFTSDLIKATRKGRLKFKENAATEKEQEYDDDADD